MSPHQFDRLRERLLCGGVSPRYVSRYMRELDDHLDDLVRDEIAKGQGHEAARQLALARLGGDDELAAALLARPGVRSFAARFPRAVFGVGPVVLLIGLVAAGIVLEGALMQLHLAFARSAAMPHPVPPEWMKLLVFAWNMLLVFAMPLVGAAIIITIGIRQRISDTWIITALAVVCIIGGFDSVVVTWPTFAGDHSELSVGFALMPPFSSTEITAGVLRAAGDMLVAGSIFFGWRRREARLQAESR